MARSRETKIELTAYDDLFQTDESREEAKLSKIRDIPISEIDEFPDHPFKVLMDEDMEQLVESIKRNGVMTPATVRLKEDGRYELISGHRRKKACELAGLETLKCEVKELTRDEAIIVMVESNLQRSVILPSEKAFAYKMRLEAMKRQAGRPPKENASPLATNLSKGRSDEELGELVGESKDQIRRYIRLTELVPEILQMVDERQIAFRPAVEISYLTEEQQYTLLEALAFCDQFLVFPGHLFRMPAIIQIHLLQHRPGFSFFFFRHRIIVNAPKHQCTKFPHRLRNLRCHLDFIFSVAVADRIMDHRI